MTWSEDDLEQMLQNNGDLGILSGALVKPVEELHVSEHDAQAAVVRWAQNYVEYYPELELLFAVPNGGKRGIRTAVRLKAEGVRRGVPDLLLPCRRPGFVGLAIEMKVGKNKPSPEQDWWLGALRVQGWYCVVCYSAAEAIGEISKYLGAE